MPDPSVFQRFVEVGRVVLIQNGPYEGKIATIVEIIDHKRALIDGPVTEVPRQSIQYRNVVLTPLVLNKLPRGARSGIVKKFFEKQEIVSKWNATSWANKLEIKKKRQSLSDFDRFNIQILKKQRRDRVRRELAKEKKASA